jgi:hypothetical protein
MIQTANYWLELNEPFSANRAYGMDAPDSVRLVPRSGTFLFTAPHAVHHYRDDATPDKASDVCTGGLCMLLGERPSEKTQRIAQELARALRGISEDF